MINLLVLKATFHPEVLFYYSKAYPLYYNSGDISFESLKPIGDKILEKKFDFYEASTKYHYDSPPPQAIAAKKKFTKAAIEVWRTDYVVFQEQWIRKNVLDDKWPELESVIRGVYEEEYLTSIEFIVQKVKSYEDALGNIGSNL